MPLSNNGAHTNSPAPPDAGAIRAQLDKILASELFQHSRRYPALLRYVVEKTIEGVGPDLKERTLGVAVFGRDPSYDTGSDPIVRTTASEVRKRLEEYYSDPSRSGEIRIAVPSGTYVPVFSGPAILPEADTPVPAPVSRGRLRRLFILTAAVLGLATAGLAVMIRFQSGKNPLHRFWAPALDTTPTLVVVETLMGVQQPASASSTSSTSLVTEILDPKLYLIMNDSNSRLASYFSSNGSSLQYELARNTSVARLRAHPFILRGAFNNPLTRQAVSSFRYSLNLDRATLLRQIVDRNDPSRHWDSPMTGTLSSISTIVSTVAAAENPILYSDDQTAASTIQDRDPGYRPSYLVYADTQRTADEAKKLVDDLGMRAHLEEYKTRVFVVGPSDGKTYDAVADLTAYQAFLKSHRSSNLKIIGIGAGATFVNDVISKHAFAVAGILTYGGTVAPGSTSTMPVPAYVHSANAAVAKQYIAANGDTGKTDSPNWTLYLNTRPNEGLQRVVVSKLSDAKESPAQAFQNAWKTVFSANYRLYMKLMESYNQAFDPNNFTDPWELEPYVMYDELGMRYEAVTEDMPGFGLALRYEYIPNAALKAPAKSVPLVIMMHGNMNDPRTQGESSGWVEVAAKNNIILTSVEWQGRKVKDTTYAAIGEAGTMAVLDKLLAEYPQIDPSRVYFTGLSAGAMNSVNWGVNNVSRIAAIAAASAPFAAPTLLDAVKKVKQDGNYLPMYFVAGNHDMYKPLPVNDTPRSFYTAIRGYALLDDITVPDAPDLKVNELFGLKLDGQSWGDLGGTRALIGTLSNSEGAMVKLVGLDPYGHWNYKPAAADMWAFVSRYRRDLTNGKLQVITAR